MYIIYTYIYIESLAVHMKLMQHCKLTILQFEKWSPSNCPLINKWTKKIMILIHTMEYYLATKMKYWYVLQHGWILKTLYLRSQSQKTTYYMISFSWSVRTGKSIETKIDLWFPWSWENWAKMGSVYFVVKLSYNWLRWRLHSSVNLLEVTEVYTYNGWIMFRLSSWRASPVAQQ